MYEVVFIVIFVSPHLHLGVSYYYGHMMGEMDNLYDDMHGVQPK